MTELEQAPMAALPHSCEQPYSLIGHFARIVGGRGWKNVRLAMFTAYFDASGARDQNVVAVAGFVTSAEAWIEWEAAWLKRLRQDGLEWFHYRELVEWEAGKKQALISDLCWIIKDHVFYKAGVVVVNETIQVLTSDEREKWGINPYTLACRNVAAQMNTWTRSFGAPYPEIFFEKGDDGQDRLDSHFELTGYPKPNIRRKRDWVNPKTNIKEFGLAPFQSADLLAQQLFSRERVFRRDGHITDGFKDIHPGLNAIAGEVGTVTTDNLKFMKEGLALEGTGSLILIPSVKINTK